MIYIRSNSDGIIESIYNIEIVNYTCVIETIPNDFDKYFIEGKYLANSNGLYIRDGWIDHTITTENWQEANWKYRIHLTDENVKFFADNYPEFLVVLNEPPKNPKYYNGFNTVYLNNIGDKEKYLFDQLGIIVEEYGD